MLTAKFRPGDEHGDVLADDKLFSTSSGNSTDAVRRFRLYPRRLAVDGLNGAAFIRKKQRERERARAREIGERENRKRNRKRKENRI